MARGRQRRGVFFLRLTGLPDCAGTEIRFQKRVTHPLSSVILDALGGVVP